MNIISTGGKFKIYGEDIQTYDRLPTRTYDVCFSNMEGYSLCARANLEITEEKIYGNSILKVQKAMKSYNASNRNFGVLLSGQKGIGKTLFLRILAKEAIRNGLPVITVSSATPGIAGFISSIDQDCVVVFDEFEKIFQISNEDSSRQDDLLSLFDGLDGGHKMFVVTCNNLNGISEYMLNRPGRFHYHFEMNPPTTEEVKEYMTDKLDPKYHDRIPDLVNLSNVINMPYDYLRAIAFELNQGYTIKETMEDLNITRDDYNRFDVEVTLSNGLTYEALDEYIDIVDRNDTYRARVRRYVRDGEKAPKSFTVYLKAGCAKIVNGEFVIEEKDIIPADWRECNFDQRTPEAENELFEYYTNNVRIVKIRLKKAPTYQNKNWNVYD